MPDLNSFDIAAYSADFRWTGQIAIPTHRRLSDFVNDNTTAALVLTQATPVMWDDHTMSELGKTETIALPKRNLRFVVNKSERALPPDSKFERVPKEPFPVILYLPPFSLTGKISLPRNADWVNIASSASENFFPVTDASVWHIKSRSKLEADVPLILVNWKWLIGMEPKR